MSVFGSMVQTNAPESNDQEADDQNSNLGSMNVEKRDSGDEGEGR